MTNQLTVEPVEAAPVEIAPAISEEVKLEPERSQAFTDTRLSAQVADKIQEIHFYITQEMWEPAKSAILDLTELAPDAPEITTVSRS